MYYTQLKTCSRMHPQMLPQPKAQQMIAGELQFPLVPGVRALGRRGLAIAVFPCPAQARS